MTTIRHTHMLFSSIRNHSGKQLTQNASFSTTTIALARSKGPSKHDKRIGLLQQHLWHPLTPRPLRLSRLRQLRHWTINEAWKIFTAKRAHQQRLELMKQWQAMQAACERLRVLGDDGVVGGANTGRLYRQSLDKDGIWAGAPIEYARTLTDWPSKKGWNHEWKRRVVKARS
ncbi:hypothetical protein BT63DRAFT_67736 [Microthyrium microscopicum]|uniref:Uncharacterized protein n=1 Tax=Microthyrium microscopicum TaxID=703497 RepID=A0A6A6U0Q1_9PEZI|nr:hypothetical protein BT63DRAFT_67736 [Microthyrium microscopicum]